MKTIDIRLNTSEETLLKGLIGKRLQCYLHDEFQFTPSSSQAVQIMMEGDRPYYLYSFTEPQDYFGAEEDVAVWTFQEEGLPIIEKKHFVKVPVGEVIQRIVLVQENQRVYSDDEQTYDIWLTRGIIIDFGNHQIAFEKDIWFSEEIIVHKGYDLANRFSPVDSFGKDWDGSVRTECSRIEKKL